MRAYDKAVSLANRIFNTQQVSITNDQANALRRAEKTLHRWAELECGDGNNHASWCIERSPVGDKPYLVTYYNSGLMHRRAIPDRERGALNRITKLCAELGLHYFHQTDPRGCALYVSAEPLTDTNYSRGVACCD